MATIFPATSIAATRPVQESEHAGFFGRFWPIFAIIAFTFAIRGVTFGNPVLELDEQLYLLVGDRMLQGQLPYVDLWDRKPIGLFLFYAGTRLLGGDGVIQYQFVVALLVAGTATIIWSLARRIAGNAGALVVSFAYVLFLNPLHGTGGQAPVVYNILTVVGAWACFRANDTDDLRRLFRLALLAMATSGIAIQFKYTPLVEGILFGCYFLHRLHQCGLGLPRLAGAAATMVSVALAPTIAAIGYFWWVGELDSFVQANFVSVFQRNPFPSFTQAQQRVFVLVIGGPLLFLAPLAAWRRWKLRTSGEERDFAFAMAWSVAALCGFGMLGDFYDFYFITVLPPLLVLIAPLIRKGRLGFAAANVILLWPLVLSPPQIGLAARHRAATHELVDAVRPFVRSRCLYVYDGPAVLYMLTNACAPSRYIYPDHLNNPTEAPALGIDPVAEVSRVLATRPGAIVTAHRPLIPRVAPESRAQLKAVLTSDYVLVARVGIDRIYDVYALRSLAPGRRPLPVPYIDPV